MRNRSSKLPTIRETNSHALDITPCLGKVRYASEDDARARSSFRPYSCVWCSGWHTSSHGFKGKRRGR